MIFFYRVRQDGVLLPAGQVVYVTDVQRQTHYTGVIGLKEVGCVEQPGWQGLISACTELELGFGALIGLKTAASGTLLSGLELAWVRTDEQKQGKARDEKVAWDWRVLRESRHEVFYQVTSVTFSSFHRYTTQLACALWAKQRRGGRKEKLGIEDSLCATLMYRQGKGTYAQLARYYGLSLSRCYDMIQWVEEALNWVPLRRFPNKNRSG